MSRSNTILLVILTLGVFGIINTEMGIIGILPNLANHFQVSISTAGLLVSAFALAVAVSGPTMPLLFSRINRKTVMVLVLGIFLISNLITNFTANFTVALIARIIPALFHPVYCSLAFTVAADSVSKEEASKAVSKVFIGVSAGMVIGVPIVSFLAETFSIELAMTFFAVVNAIVLLATHANKSVLLFPFVLSAVYVVLFLFGSFTLPMVVITLLWGILAGIGANINQYWIISAAPESPDFANGLFLTGANLGTTVGAAVGGFFIAQLGTPYVVLVGLLSLLLSFVSILMREFFFERHNAIV
ncbi:MFS transporter [Priestia flexa]|uniref:MFS transporter n=1 Tax=Priestia flexa TaxID=86664 RepID=UPI000956D9DA|nr:MFS transporter [Priestia flexa]MBY6087278.1 MFS transporter [Priestia flexa]SIR25486.1 Major Facilitator Superfamily protein [Priestia flexa]